MASKILSCCFLIFCLYSINANAQSVDSARIREFVVADTLDLKKPHKEDVDTVAWLQGESIVDNNTVSAINAKQSFEPNSTKAVLYGLIPGGGQFYNRKYWKLPLVYGGFIALTYAISWNGRYYGEYKDAYAAIMRDDRFSPGVIEKWQPFLRPNTDPNSLSSSQIVSLQNSFKRSRDSYRRNRDLSIIGMVALYAITMIDAYVDAELFDFDISPDLSLRVEPTNMNPSGQYPNNNVGIQCSLRF